MKKTLWRILVGLLLLAIAVPVLAAYIAEITVTESLGTSYTQLALNYTLNVTYLADHGYITSTGLDTRVTTTDYEVLPHMLAADRLMFVSDIPASSTTNLYFITGNTPLASFPIITGHGGYVTVADNADLELGNIYAFLISGYVDTSSGANKTIIRKDGAVSLNVTASQEITFSITGGVSLVATSVSSGYMVIRVLSDGLEAWMDIDEVEQDRDTASAVPDTSNNWVLFENDVMPYVYYFGLWVE